MEKALTYTTRGSVRGSCGHRHRSLRTTIACLKRDTAGCQAQGGYSDRQALRTDGTDINSDELDYVVAALSNDPL